MKLDKISEILSLSTIEGVPVGEIKNYRYSIANFSYGSLGSRYGYAFVLDKPITAENLNLFRQTYGKFITMQISSIGSAHILYVPSKYGFSEKGIAKDYPFLEKLAELFDFLGYESFKACPFSRATQDLTPKVIHNVLFYVNLEAYHGFVNQQKQLITDEKARTKFLPMSILLAAAGAMIGAIPTILIAQMGYILGLLTALIPIASFYGYKLGKGPKTNISLVVIIIFSLIAGASSILITYTMIANENGYSLKGALETSEFAAAFLRDLIVSLVFTLIGVFISWRYLKNQTVQLTI